MPPLAPGLKASYNKMKHGWTAGHNLRLDFRFGLDDPDRLRKYATELVALAPDMLFSGGGSAVAALQQATVTLPIVFANALDAVGEGYVATLRRRVAMPPFS